jgi:hypothetical protein
MHKILLILAVVALSLQNAGARAAADYPGIASGQQILAAHPGVLATIAILGLVLLGLVLWGLARRAVITHSARPDWQGRSF